MCTRHGRSGQANKSPNDNGICASAIAQCFKNLGWKHTRCVYLASKPKPLPSSSRRREKSICWISQLRPGRVAVRLATCCHYQQSCGCELAIAHDSRCRSKVYVSGRDAFRLDSALLNLYLDARNMTSKPQRLPVNGSLLPRCSCDGPCSPGRTRRGSPPFSSPPTRGTRGLEQAWCLVRAYLAPHAHYAILGEPGAENPPFWTRSSHTTSI